MRFQKYVWQVARRLAAQVSYWVRCLLAEERHVQVDLGPIVGKRGESLAVTCAPDGPFCCERMRASDTSRAAGRGTMIERVFVGAFSIGPHAGAICTAEFMESATVSQALRGPWRVCAPGEKIDVVVRFEEDCTWYASLFGRGLFLPENTYGLRCRGEKA